MRSLIILTFILLYSPGHLFGQDITTMQYFEGAIVRGDRNKKAIALVFTGDEYADGGQYISGILREKQIKGSFFFTGRFYRDPTNELLINTLISDGHYLGAHSDRHLLYCDWDNRDSLLVDFATFSSDLESNYQIMQLFGIARKEAKYFLPPYEWYNNQISKWCRQMGIQLINYTPGTLSHTDYTTHESSNYRSSREIFDSILDYESTNENGLNGFILLLHIGSSPDRTDKFHCLLDDLIDELANRNYSFCRIDRLLEL